MRRIAGLRSAALALLAVTLPAASASGADNGRAAPAPVPVSAPALVEEGPQFAVPTTPDAIGRVMAPVYVNGRGPFRFIVDTGANRSVLAPHTARALGIDSDAAPRQLVHGVTGAEPAPMAHVGELRFGRLSRAGLDLPVLSNRIHANADGMLGSDHMSGGRLTIDFRRDRIDLSPMSAPPPPTYFVLPAQMRLGRLPLINARLGKVNVKAVIDTGAERSIGNGALRRALEAANTRLVDQGMTTVYGAVGPNAQARLLWAPRLMLADVRIDRLPVLFADTHFFTLWELEDEPALLLGMDVLGQLDVLVVDYRRNEVLFKVGSGKQGVYGDNRASRIQERGGL